MIGSPAKDILALPRTLCCICAESVSLEVSKTNEYGQAVHENCYVQQLKDLKWPLDAIHVTTLSYRIVGS